MRWELDAESSFEVKGIRDPSALESFGILTYFSHMSTASQSP